MDPACILMCANIPRGIPEDVLAELFCVAGPIEEVSISKSGRSCFIIYEFPEAVPTAKEIFKDVELFGRPLEMLDESDIKQIHDQQEHESLEFQQQKEVANAEITKQYNPFYNRDSMTPTFHNNPRGYGHPRNFPPPHNLFHPSQNQFNNIPNQFNPLQNPYNPAPNHTYGDNYDPSVPTRRWDSAPDPNQVPSFPPELVHFQNPYSQSVSRKNYEQNRKNDYDDDVSDTNYSANRETNCYSKRHPEHRRNQNDNGEYENRKQTYDHSRKPYRDNDRYDNSKYNGASSSSDYSNRQKSRDYDRSPYPRNEHRRSDHRDSRRQDYYHKEQRNHRR